MVGIAKREMESKVSSRFNAGYKLKSYCCCSHCKYFCAMKQGSERPTLRKSQRFSELEIIFLDDFKYWWSLALYSSSCFFILSVAPHSRGQHFALSEAGMPFWHCTLTWNDSRSATQNSLKACSIFEVSLRNYFPLGLKLLNQLCFCTSNHLIFCFQTQTLLVFFNKMWFHWPMMSIHLASRCLTNSGAGPTFLRWDNGDNSPLTGWLLYQSVCTLHVCHFRHRQHVENQKRKQENHTAAVLSLHGNRRGCSPLSEKAEIAVDSKLSAWLYLMF